MKRYAVEVTHTHLIVLMICILRDTRNHIFAREILSLNLRIFSRLLLSGQSISTLQKREPREA